MDEQRLLTRKELADRLRVSTATIQRWARSGKLPAARIPGSRSVRFQWTAVLRALGVNEA